MAQQGGESLPALVTRAAQALAAAATDAEILEARELAGAAFDAAKRAERLAKARKAHDHVVAAALRAQSDALIIEGKAKARLADEYNGAQERGEVRTRADNQHVPGGNKLSTADLGLTRKLIMEGRRIRAAEERDPGIVERTLTEAVERGEAPTRAMISRAVSPAEAMNRRAAEEEADWQRKQDEKQFKSLRNAYNKSRVGAQAMFREWLTARK